MWGGGGGERHRERETEREMLPIEGAHFTPQKKRTASCSDTVAQLPQEKSVADAPILWHT